VVAFASRGFLRRYTAPVCDQNVYDEDINSVVDIPTCSVKLLANSHPLIEENV